MWAKSLGKFLLRRLDFFCDVEGNVICSEGEGFVRGRLTGNDKG